MDCKFSKGDRVVVVSECNAKGIHGIVTKSSWQESTLDGGHYIVTVLLDEKMDNVNTKSFNEKSLCLESEFQCDSVDLLHKHGVVDVELDYNKNAQQFACYESYAVGDVVVVRKNGMLLVGTVLAVYTEEETKGRNFGEREVIGKVDLGAYKERQTHRERLVILKKEMDAIVQEQERTQIYEALAVSNPLLADKLAEYKALAMGNC